MVTKDFYEEKGVKAKKNVKRIMAMWVMGILALASLVGSYWIIACLVVTVTTGTAFFMMFRERDIEYDYCFTNDEIEIGKIINRKRRRRAISFNTSNIKFIAPEDSIRLSNERERDPQMRFTDYTSQEPKDKVYGFRLDLRGIQTIILMEPTETMMEHLRMLIPSKIYED